jgi:hypothetical protein
LSYATTDAARRPSLLVRTGPRRATQRGSAILKCTLLAGRRSVNHAMDILGGKDQQWSVNLLSVAYRHMPVKSPLRRQHPDPAH